MFIDLIHSDFQRLKLAGGVLELLVFDQPTNEFKARILFILFADLGLGFLVGGQEFPAFDVDQGGRHHQELASDFEVQFPHLIDIGNELRGDSSEVDLVNVDLLLLDQVQQQIQRPFEHVELNPVFVHQTERYLFPARQIDGGTRGI